MMYTPMSQLADMIAHHATQAQCDGPDSSYHLQKMIALQGQAYAQRMNSMNSRTCLGDYDWDSDPFDF